MNKFLAHDDTARAKMLEQVGLSRVDELFSQIPAECRIENLNLPSAKSELEVSKIVENIANSNNTNYACFLGGGAYNHYVPSGISAITSRFEFLSAYTPYQAEISQGTLESMYDFQTMICKLTNQDVSNASVYDGASAAAEALLMSVRINKIPRVFVSSNINPDFLQVIKTYLWAGNIELEVGDIKTRSAEYSGVLYQSPNYFGEIEQDVEKRGKELLIASVNLTSLALLEPPNVDITTGDFQTLGLALSFGGPYGGFIACNDAYKRQLAGRIVGKTVDREGKEAYTLTLQAREQHIRREKATSNICSNQALSALCATIYMDLTGEDGFIEIAQKSAENAHKLAQGLENKGYKILSENFFNEFLYEVKNADEFLENMQKNGILAGIKIDGTKILTATTEMNSDEEIERYIELA